jgi:hypothetical protein
MDANACGAFVFLLILLLAVLGAHYVHTKHVKYATEGSVALLLGFGVTGLTCGTYYAAYKEPLPAHWLRFDDNLIFEVCGRVGAQEKSLDQQRTVPGLRGCTAAYCQLVALTASLQVSGGTDSIIAH